MVWVTNTMKKTEKTYVLNGLGNKQHEKDRKEICFKWFGASSIEKRRPGYGPLVGKYGNVKMSLPYNGFVNKINENVKMSLLYNGVVNKINEHVKMSLLYNGFVNKINEHVKNVIDFKWSLTKSMEKVLSLLNS